MSALSGEEFARLAGDRPAVVTERSLTLIREQDLPENWLETTVDCYSTEADYYELAQYGHTQALKATVNDFVAEALSRTEAAAVLDVGVGDGHRLDTICGLVEKRCDRRPAMYGIELSDAMIERARARGVRVTRADMRKGIPAIGTALDGVLFLSGDLGYLMDPAEGDRLRLDVLDSAHESLRPGGVVVLELVSRDPRPAPGGADVFYFSRTPTVRDSDGAVTLQGPETWQFIKTFTKAETVALIGRSRFDAAAATLRYVVRDSADVARIGRYVDDAELCPEESYRLLVSLVR